MAINYPTSADTFTTKIDNVNDVMAVDVNDVQDAVEILEKRVGITGDEAIVATTKMLIYANTAPANWTIDAALDDKLVFVTKGSVAGGQTGGGVHSTGSWTQPNHSHSHKWYDYITGANHKDGAGTNITTNTENGGSVGITGAGGSATYITSDFYTDTNTAEGASDNTWRPAAYCFIICTKDAYPTS